MIAETGEFTTIIEEINELLLYHASSNKEMLQKAVADLVNGGGKRIRPILVILAARSGADYERKKIMKIATAVEIFHMATLVHDDIVDEARLRRNNKTAQSRFGKDVAVFTGDFLLTKALDLMMRNVSHHTLLRFNRIIKLICEGEVDQYQARYNTALTLTGYLRHIRRKTALLFAFSTYAGAYESGLREGKLYHLYNLGLEMGMTFQIQDDILDFNGVKKQVGKEVGQDLSEGVYTLPVIKYLEQGQNRDKVRKILGKRDLKQKEVEEVISLIQKSDALTWSKKLGERFLKKARFHLQQLEAGQTRSYLDYILSYQLARNR